MSGDDRTHREGWTAVTEDSGHDLRNELERLKKRARGVFGGRKESGTPPAAQVPPVPEAPPAGEGLPAGEGAPRPEVPVFAEIPVTDEQLFTVPTSGRIEDLVPGKAVETPAGWFYRVRERAGDIWERGAATHQEYINAIASSPAKLPAGCRSLQALTSSPAGVVYLDLETTGLRNTPLFLVGLMYSEGEDLVVDQLFARDYTEERAVLSFVYSMLDSREVLVTFNGNTFDIPFLANRMTFHALPMRMPRSHVDLLPISRSLMKGRTPNHRLQTLERFVLGRKRTGDIPGSEIPGAYHEFVRTQDARQMAAVIHHNRLDLLSMLELITVYLTNI
jgi:uncharacterized protein YprB with RNaseH-like and TPR domain